MWSKYMDEINGILMTKNEYTILSVTDWLRHMTSYTFGHYVI